MTQVWMLRNSDTDIHVFNRHEHLRPSVEISWSACKDVIITELRAPHETTYYVLGKRDGVEFSDTVVFKCLPVWTEPCHL